MNAQEQCKSFSGTTTITLLLSVYSMDAPEISQGIVIPRNYRKSKF